MKLLQIIGSLKFALLGIVLLFWGVASAYHWREHALWLLSGAIAIATLSLVAAILTQPKFRQQPPLLVFHLALLAIVFFVALGRLTYLKGGVGIVEGAEFDGQLLWEDSGPWHRSRLDQVRFVNEGFTINYRPGIRRDDTRNTLRIIRDQEPAQRVVIGDQTPYEKHGYRFYTSFNKGFSPVFIWAPNGGEPQLGGVNLPGYPINQYDQATTWTPPGSDEELWIQLQFDELILDPTKPSAFRAPSDYQLVVRRKEERTELKPGDHILLSDGRLMFKEVRSWMGYNIFYDWTIPWLLASCAVAVGSLGWYFLRKFRTRPWEQTDGTPS